MFRNLSVKFFPAMPNPTATNPIKAVTELIGIPTIAPTPLREIARPLTDSADNVVELL